MGVDDNNSYDDDDDRFARGDPAARGSRPRVPPFAAYDGATGTLVVFPLDRLHRFPNFRRLIDETDADRVLSETLTFTTSDDDRLCSPARDRADSRWSEGPLPARQRRLQRAAAGVRDDDPCDSLAALVIALVDAVPTSRVTEANADASRVVDYAMTTKWSSGTALRYNRFGTIASKRRLWDAARVWTGDAMRLSLYTRALDFERALRAAADYGFVEARVDPDRRASILMTYWPRVSTSETISRALALVAGMTRDVFELRLIISLRVANELTAYVVADARERGGALTIARYDDDGWARARIDPRRVVVGDERVSVPLALQGPLGFHTHAAAIMRAHGDYIAFPSGRDIASVLERYLFYRDELVEFVASPEGLWFIHLTVAFQRALLAFKARIARGDDALAACCRRLVDDVAARMSFSALQKLTNAPTERMSVDAYLERVNGATLSRFFMSPDDAAGTALVDACRLGRVEDARLLDVGFVPWHAFACDDGGGVRVSFSYVLDEPGGLPAVLGVGM
jgi:hypothetical protein